ncbi:MAG: histidinol-phosphatase [Clostridia bacterium]|nr:histidinol-phosphatase [Clostridia bacterium]
MSEIFNLHTHTVYCDGDDTPEELVTKAINKGFCALGFSGHMNSFDAEVSMSREGERKYLEEINSLKEKYKDKIRILAGVERDYYESEPLLDYDYVIGSVHYLKIGDEYLPLDYSAPRFEEIASVCGGYKKLCENYFSLVGDTLSKINADIIGHFDLIVKYNEGGVFFDEEDPVYLKYATDAMEKLCHIPFEVNTGAGSRGYKNHPYPSITLLKKLRDMGGSVVYSSDCHAKENLDYGYKDALEYIKEAGFDRFLTLDEVKQWK